MLSLRTCCLLALATSAVFAVPAVPPLGNDPAGSWLSYAVFKAENNQPITALNTSWIVPSEPKVKFGSNAPGWWFGIQTASGGGALIQPILAWDYMGHEYSIFNACFDWNDQSWHTSPETYKVQPGDRITSSVTYRPADNSYDMYIEADGKSITTNYKIEAAQGKTPESVAYFVLEHQPDLCSAYPGSDVCTFENITVAVADKIVDSPTWEAKQEQPACKSEATIVDPHTIKFTWQASKEAETAGLPPLGSFPNKWGTGRHQ
mmetsp:Transcript_46837/g.101748  ORF Transcript_46837/g.101748 Transcript_46837/m.101748 type:complete len:262 (+) Transcript_46837:2-787(+)